MKNLIENLQNKSYETRVKILWGTTAVIGIVLIVVWVMSLKSTIKNSSNDQTTTNPAQNTQTNQGVNFITVEHVETAAGSLKIYFNINNDTSDILNVSKLEDITLALSQAPVHPTTIQDRQGQPFVQKVLSQTQAFGILVFGPTKETSAQLTFDNMFLEAKSDQILSQELNLDFTKLNQIPNVRN